MAQIDPVRQAHRSSIQKSLPEMARFLDETLTRSLLMFLIDVKDPKTIARWANAEVSTVRNLETERRLRAVDQIVELLLLVDDPRVIRGWFFGMNPLLEDEAPSLVIREGRLQEAVSAARGYVAMNW